MIDISISYDHMIYIDLNNVQEMLLKLVAYWFR